MRDVHKMRVFRNKLLKSIYEVTGVRTKDIMRSSSTNTIRLTNSRRLRLSEHVVRMREKCSTKVSARKT